MPQYHFILLVTALRLLFSSSARRHTIVYLAVAPMDESGPVLWSLNPLYSPATFPDIMLPPYHPFHVGRWMRNALPQGSRLKAGRKRVAHPTVFETSLFSSTGLRSCSMYIRTFTVIHTSSILVWLVIIPTCIYNIVFFCVCQDRFCSSESKNHSKNLLLPIATRLHH
jgi:hypothetical protein